MARAALSRSENLNRTHAGAVAPNAGAVGSLLSQYSLRLGDTLLRHRAELAERAARIEAEMASRVKSDFIANISHELRTPLNSILGFAKLLKGAQETPLEPAQVSEYAGFILGSAEGLLTIVNDVITISKLQSGTFAVSIDEIDLQKTLEVCISEAQEKASDRGQDLVIRIDPETPPVLADAEQLKNIVSRLLDNSMNFTPEGGTVALTIKPASESQVAICISDNGIGMNEEETAIALTEFGQVDNRHDRHGEGTGLGLPIARALTEQQGGRFIIRSEKERGTDIVLLFPAVAQTPENGHASGPAATGPRA